MTTQKKTTNVPLKVAIVESRQTQKVVAALAGLHEVQLCRLVTGRVVASQAERRALSRVLRRPQRALFPEPHTPKQRPVNANLTAAVLSSAIVD